MENKLIDPYGLLGVDSRSNLSKLKKNYYNLALLCHPDKGGNDKDMNVISLAYNYIKNHLENVKETSYEKLEQEFEDFCSGQESIKPPSFGQIYEETNDWINDFNSKFESMKIEESNIFLDQEEIENNPYLHENNPLLNGYGEFMDTSDYNKEDLVSGKEFKPIVEEKVKNEFKGEIMIYKEPLYLPDTITSFPLQPMEISDYSGNVDDIRMSDYKKAFTPPEEGMDVEEKYYPKENMEYNSSV